MKFNSQVFATCYLSFVLVLMLCSCEGKKGKTPVIYITDLYHPFNFENVRVRVDSNAVLHYSDTGNRVYRFRISGPTNYGTRMTTIYNSLTKEF